MDLKFPYPVTIALLGLVTTTCASALVVHLTVPRSQRQHVSVQHYLKRVLPTGFCMALTFHTGELPARAGCTNEPPVMNPCTPVPVWQDSSCLQQHLHYAVVGADDVSCCLLLLIPGNMAYLYLSVSFIQMLKALCPVITMVSHLVSYEVARQGPHLCHTCWCHVAINGPYLYVWMSS